MTKQEIQSIFTDHGSQTAFIDWVEHETGVKLNHSWLSKIATGKSKGFSGSTEALIMLYLKSTAARQTTPKTTPK